MGGRTDDIQDARKLASAVCADLKAIRAQAPPGASLDEAVEKLRDTFRVHVTPRHHEVLEAALRAAGFGYVPQRSVWHTVTILAGLTVVLLIPVAVAFSKGSILRGVLVFCIGCMGSASLAFLATYLFDLVIVWPLAARRKLLRNPASLWNWFSARAALGAAHKDDRLARWARRTSLGIFLYWLIMGLCGLLTSPVTFFDIP